MKLKKFLMTAVLSGAFASGAFALDLAEDIKTTIEIRPRWENAQVDNNGLKTANSFTTRIRVGTKLVNLGGVEGLSLFFEPWVVNALWKDYRPEKSGYELIPDPEQVRINQVYVGYKAKLFSLKVGRQQITFDNHRFIGNVGWRQMAQTFDAVRLDLNPIKDLTLNLVYVGAKTGVTDTKAGEKAVWVFAPHNTYIGEDTPVNDSLLFRANYSLSAYKTNITLYSYLLNGMHDTYGLKVNGSPTITGNISVGFWGEVAYQKDPTLTDHETVNQNIEAYYYYVSLKPQYKSPFGNVFVEVGYEFLEGADRGETRGFTTPLATLHGHNGWADAFLAYTGVSNTYGLEDFRVGGGIKSKTLGKLALRYHTFKADKSFPGGGDKFGNEIDVVYTKKVLKNLTVGAKAALYDADDEARNAGVADKDIKKFWVWLTYRWSM